MAEVLNTLSTKVIASFLEAWPYLLVTIPLAVAVRASGASKYIGRAFNASPVAAVFLATAVGAFSPFCSCSVIPVVAALLIGGVPLAPVMSFWIASPSMDPEAFFLSVATLGWELAIWRLGATLVLSLAAGFITMALMQRGWLGETIIRQGATTETPSTWQLLKRGWDWLTATFAARPQLGFTVVGATPAPEGATCSCGDALSEPAKSPSRWAQIGRETWDATLMVFKFMLLAFILEALIEMYIPAPVITSLLGPQNPWAILSAAILGVPVYTSNLAALPLMSGLLKQGMDPAAVLAFLISGPTTTLPAMGAVWGITTKRVFALYVSFALFGAVIAGYAYALAHLAR